MLWVMNALLFSKVYPRFSKKDIYKCPFFKKGPRELKFSYINLTVPIGPSHWNSLFLYKNFESTRSPVLLQRRCAGIWDGFIWCFVNRYHNGTGYEILNIHICYDKIWILYGIYYRFLKSLKIRIGTCWNTEFHCRNRRRKRHYI